MEIVGSIADLLGVIGAVFSLFAWLKAREIKKDLDAEQERQKQKIRVVLRHGGRDSVELPVPIRRSEFNRAEVLGRLGVIPLKDKRQHRFKITHLNESDFSEDLDALSQGSGDGTLTISCTEEEMKQFDFERMRK